MRASLSVPNAGASCSTKQGTTPGWFLANGMESSRNATQQRNRNGVPGGTEEFIEKGGIMIGRIATMIVAVNVIVFCMDIFRGEHFSALKDFKK